MVFLPTYKMIMELKQNSDLILGGPYTMFAPTDEAINRIPRETLNKIIGDPTILKPILQRHIIPNKVF